MQTDVILISSNGTAMENALAQADLVADYKHLSHQEALHLRLLTEEMVGMMRSITGETKGKFWIEDESGVWYFPFDAKRYRGVCITATADFAAPEDFTPEEKVSALTGLYEKGVITAAQYISRLPDSLIPEKAALFRNLKENENETKQHI